MGDGQLVQTNLTPGRQTDLCGLSEAEVLERQARGLGNTTALRTSRSYALIISENVFVPVNILMFVLGLALILLGQVSDALISVGVAFFNVLVGTVQEIRARRVLDRIALLTRPHVRVLRSGHERSVDPGELVVGDLLPLGSGDQIVVDGPLVSDERIEVDEALLSGESEPVSKRKGDWLYSGSFCTSGSGYYRAEKVGGQSLASQLTTSARAFRRVYTPLQRQINVVMQVMLLVALYFEVMLGLAMYIDRLSLVEGVRMAVVILGIVPKGLLLATSVAYALGAVRMVGAGILVQQANAIEALSGVDVLCLDKTGTITTNILALEDIHPLQISAPRLRQLLGDYAASVSTGTATSAAIGTARAGVRRPVREEVIFSSERKWSALAFDDADMPGIYVLGAPEILRSALRRGQDFESLIAALAKRGLRVLLFAYHAAGISLYDDHAEPVLPSDLIPLGIISLRDQLRPEAHSTLAAFAQAGIQLKVISGDHPETVAALAKQAGLQENRGAISGNTLAGLDDAQMAQAAEEHTIFGRITPQQKAQLVQALRKRGHTVAMIGDGVNDVLSLKQSNLGIALQSGSAATRGVADIVLLNNSFAALPRIFREGQRIRNGMHSILKLFLTRVVYMICLLVAIMIVDGFPFVPRQNAILTLITEGIPALALASWAQPRPLDPRRTVSGLLHFVLPAATTLSIAALGIYLAIFVPAGRLATAQSALTTFTILCGLLLLPFVEPPIKFLAGGSRLGNDWRPSLLALGLLAGYGVLLAIAPLRAFFELDLLSLRGYLLIGLVAVAWAGLVQLLWRTRLLERFLQLDWREE
jgi:cation-transporting ATPase E